MKENCLSHYWQTYGKIFNYLLHDLFLVKFYVWVYFFNIKIGREISDKQKTKHEIQHTVLGKKFYLGYHKDQSSVLCCLTFFKVTLSLQWIKQTSQVMWMIKHSLFQVMVLKIFFIHLKMIPKLFKWFSDG